MGDKAIPLVKDAIKAITPGYSIITKLLLAPAEIFWFASLVGRKIRLFSQPKNMIPLMAGSILDAAFGKMPTAQKAARIVFGSASIMRCSEDLLKIIDQCRTISRIIKGESYIVIRRKHWENVNANITRSPSDVYYSRVKKIQDPILIKRFFQCIWEIVKSIGLFTLHFADACTAYREKNTTSEIFVHGLDIFNKITSSESKIVKHLKRLENVTNRMLKGIGASWATTALIGLFVLPAKIRQKMPGIHELFANFKNNFALIQEKLDAFAEYVSLEYLELLNKTRLINKVPPKFIPQIERQFDFFIKGVNDPDTLRFIEKPIFRKLIKP